MAAVDDSLTAVQAAALLRYMRSIEALETPRSGLQAVERAEAVAHAQKALSHAQRAVVEIIPIRGQSVASAAKIAGRSQDYVVSLLRSACDALALHYESQGSKS